VPAAASERDERRAVACDRDPAVICLRVAHSTRAAPREERRIRAL